ncbi:hypothetical protein LIER_21866 [Lithospermum erythrorhizon]|uniref:Uncharacterized protein n=1 Tax=Lithospermum erythrorhizon TaxID=34254 RepID=A0AAV3QRR2_LITER
MADVCFEGDGVDGWTKGVRKIGIFVAHPTRRLAKSLLLGEVYGDLRSKWSKATLKEIDDEEARLLGFKESCKADVGRGVGNGVGNVQLLPWYPVEEEGIERLEEHHTEVQGDQRMEDGEVEVQGVDDVEV